MNQEMIGESAVMQELRLRILEAAGSDLPCLITGETGSGKELVAWAIHKASGRASFQPLNCASLPRELIHSELFGYRRRAFTGATEDREGLFAAADGGTLFLDEIGDLPTDQQGAFLRALDYGEVRPVGASRHHTVVVQVRVLAATNMQLAREVEKDRFRQDLYYRLRGCEISVPPLRDRLEDIPELARYFANRRGEFSPEAIELMMQYHWPGNVRELKYVVGAAIHRTQGKPVLPVHLPPEIGQPEENPCGEKEKRGIGFLEIDNADRILFVNTMRILKQVSGKKTEAANRLGVSRRTIARWLKRWQAKGWINEGDSLGRDEK